MNYWQEKIKIGKHAFPRFIGGPLDGITDSPFRSLVRDFSKEELLFTEMRHVACVANDKSGRPLKFYQTERPLNYQVAANSDKFIDAAFDKIIAAGVDVIDLNVGCPAKNVTRSGSGSALMDDLPRLKIILQRIAARCTEIPFTVKIRAGYKTKNAIEVAKLIQDCGASALTIHPRLRSELFNGRPDYALAAQVKQAVSIPVLLSGNVINFVTARMAYEQTGVDGFLIGRGIWSKPWKLYEMQEHAAGRSFVADRKMILTYALKHFDVMQQYYGDHGLYCFRKHLPFYLRGLPGASALRNELVTSTDGKKIRDHLQTLVGVVSEDMDTN